MFSITICVVATTILLFSILTKGYVLDQVDRNVFALNKWLKAIAKLGYDKGKGTSG